jgi:hypothetical protein
LVSIFRKPDPPRAAWCNLRQALQWLRDEAVPVQSDFERALGEGRDFQEEEFGLQKKHLCAALQKGLFPLHGRPGFGLFKDNHVGLRPIYQHAGYDDYEVIRDAKGNIEIWFDEYGDQENIEIEAITAAGLRGFDFAAGKLTHITAWDDKGRPARALQYIDVVIATADLLKEFPAVKPDDPLATPLPEVPIKARAMAADNSRPRKSATGLMRRIGQGMSQIEHGLASVPELFERYTKVLQVADLEPMAPGVREVAASPNGGASPGPGASRPAKFGIDSSEPGYPTEDTDAAPSRASVTELRTATPANIHETISAIYAYATAQGMSPPNLHDIAKHVLRRLELNGMTATLVRIQGLADDQRHAGRRRKQGHRLYGTLLPFSDAEV